MGTGRAGTQLGRALLGSRYYYSAGWGRRLSVGPLSGTAWRTLLERGVLLFDCSGFVTALLVADGLWPSTAPAPRAVDLANWCKPVAVPSEGDLGFFGVNGVSHVVYVTVGGADPHIIGANGGGSHTFGDDAGACIKEQRGYWPEGFICWGRPPGKEA